MITDSTEAGLALVRASTGKLKKVSLEPGGKSPNSVFADADLEAVLKGRFMGSFFCPGETCSADTRRWVKRDIRKAHQAAAALDAGTVWVNCYNAFDTASPWGGLRQSGWGREKGPYGLDLFTQVKSVFINFS